VEVERRENKRKYLISVGKTENKERGRSLYFSFMKIDFFILL
jgi:hypothetical protein